MTIATRPTIPGERFEARLAAASRAAASTGFDALLIGVGADLRYLTGYNAHESERLTMLVVGRAARSATLVVPLLERPAAEAGSRVDIPIATWTETQDPAEVVARLARGASASPSRVGVSDRLWSLHLLRLQIDPAEQPDRRLVVDDQHTCRHLPFPPFGVASG